MKKLVTLGLSAVMVLTLAAASMAAATVKGDFRYDMFEDDNSKSGDKSYSVSDLRVNVSGDISEKVSASATFQLQHGKDGVQGAYNVDPMASYNGFDVNEYFVTYKESWGGVKAGYYEYKFTPSRVLLKTAKDKHVWDKVDVLIATTINTPVEGLTADVLFQPYAQAGKTGDDGAYGVAVNYNQEKFGAKVSYADFKQDKTLTALDVYYMITEGMKVFVDGADYDKGDGKNGLGNEGFDPIVGFSWDKIAGTNFFAAIEYALEARDQNTANEWNEYTANVKYKFNDGVGLEVEHYVVGDGKTKDMVRLRYQF